MNEKKKLLILVAVMVVLIGGASLLYTAMKDSLEMPGLVVQESGSQETPAEGDTDASSVEDNANREPGQSVENSSESANSEEEGETATEETAPDFTVYDAAGNAYKLSDFRGKPVIVNFWASWCGPCKSEMPDFQELYEEYGEEIHFLMVNMTDGSRETVKSASAYIADSGYTFPVYYDTDMDATYTYGVFSIPTTYFFDGEGHGIAYGQGAMDKDTIMTGIDMILK